jgi:hypothetical protein
MQNPLRLRDDQEILRIQYNHILDAEALFPLTVIWKESKYVTDAELAAARLVRAFDPKGVTATALAKAMQAADCLEPTFTSPGKYVQRVRRIVIGAQTYGLIDLHDESAAEYVANWKPLHGTGLLHELMLTLGSYANQAILDNGYVGPTDDIAGMKNA